MTTFQRKKSHSEKPALGASYGGWPLFYMAYMWHMKPNFNFLRLCKYQIIQAFLIWRGIEQPGGSSGSNLKVTDSNPVLATKI